MTALILDPARQSLTSQNQVSIDERNHIGTHLLSDREVFFTETPELTEQNSTCWAQWRQSVTNQLLDLMNLEEDWDTYGSPPPDTLALNRSHRILEAFARMPFSFPVPSIQATSEGGITINWCDSHAKREFGLEIDANDVVAFFSDPANNEAWEAPGDDDRVSGAILRLVAG